MKKHFLSEKSDCYFNNKNRVKSRFHGCLTKKILKIFQGQKKSGSYSDPDLEKTGSLYGISLVILVGKIYIYAGFLSLTIFEEVGSNLREQCV